MKAKTIFYCTQCGNEFPKWQGQCPACGAWNTIVEQPAAPKGKGPGKPARALGSVPAPKLVSEMSIDQEIRFPTGLAELDRVLGGGAVQGSLVLIGGAPGIGKSTLALSAPRPLHIDVDFGIDRIDPRYRKPYIQPKDYDEILSDLVPENLEGFDTLVFDTGGKLISLMSMWAIKKDPKYGMRDGSLSLKGYGFVGKEFVRLMDYCFYELKKNIVIVFHAVEEKDGDNTRLRIKVEGQTKNNVWEPMDLGGFVEIYGNDRTIGFSNCERYFAKGTRGISGVIKIPALGPASPNDFLTKLFERYNAQAASEVEQNAEQQEAYEKAMALGHQVISMVKNAETANTAMKPFKEIEHALSSKKELNTAWNDRIRELGLVFNAETKLYEQPQQQEAPEGESE